ncbi:hypothetical protein [Brachybacterium sp. AOP24-D1-21]|uniref:hypothetical protein n=1 Tax=Brachybacterium sp. AOP24-D1-21 TaxID=3457711 RepID=UPI004033396A
MDRNIRDGIFATLPGIEGAESSFLAFEQGQPVLHLDLSPLDSAQLLQQRRIEGYTRNVARFTATLNGSFTTNGRFTCALDDLLVEVPWDEDRGGFDRDVVHSAFAFFDPRAVDQFFFQEFLALGTAVDGEVISLDNADLAHKYTPAHAKNLAISLTTRSALYGPAADVLSRSNYERVCLRMDFTEPTDLDTARRKIAAVQSLIEAIGKPGPHYLRELSVLSSEPGTEGLSIVDWWSKVLLGERGAVPNSDGDPLRSGGFSDGRLGPTGLKELGGLAALGRWIDLCDDVPHLLSVLDAQSRGFALDARASILSLAVGWEHLAAHSRGAVEQAAWREISALVTDAKEYLEVHRQMIELCWNTYTKIKHVALRGGESDSRATIRDDDHESLELAAEFMYLATLAAAFKIADIPDPYPVTFRLFAHDDERGWWPQWTEVATTYSKTS